MSEDPFQNKPKQLKLKIEVARPEDWQDYKKIRLEALEKNSEAFRRTLAEALQNTDQKWKDALSGDKVFMFLARNDLEPIGLAGAKKVVEQGENIWRVISVYVRKEFRGGLGRRLMENVLAEIRRRGGSKVVLGVRKADSQIPA